MLSLLRGIICSCDEAVLCLLTSLANQEVKGELETASFVIIMLLKSRLLC